MLNICIAIIEWGFEWESILGSIWGLCRLTPARARTLGLYAILIYNARQGDDNWKKNNENTLSPTLQTSTICDVIYLHHLILKDRIVIHLKTHIHLQH